jgi:hypothetical protein
MTIYTPTFKIRIAGVEYTNEVLSNATITTGRNDFFEPTLPSYCNLELINLSGTSPAINLLDIVNIQVKDTNNVFIDLFTGEVSSVQNTIEGAGANDQYANTVQVQAIGVLGLLVKRYAGSVAYPQEFDGQRIERILEETLYTAWEDLSNITTWNDLPALQTWQDYGVQGIDVIDNGRYEVLARSAQVEQANELTDVTATTGLGYLYETGNGLIGYADAERRSTNYGTNTIAVDADILSSAGFTTRLQTADIINSVVIQYNDPVAEEAAENDTSIDTYGLLQQIVPTILAEQLDAQEQAARTVALRGLPKVSLDSVSLNLSNPNITDAVRNSLLGVSMDTLIAITNIPTGIITSGVFEGFCEGWTWTLSKNSLDLDLAISNSIYSSLDVQWEDYNPLTQWQNLPNDLTWLDVA